MGINIEALGNRTDTYQMMISLQDHFDALAVVLYGVIDTLRGRILEVVDVDQFVSTRHKCACCHFDPRSELRDAGPELNVISVASREGKEDQAPV